MLINFTHLEVATAQVYVRFPESKRLWDTDVAKTKTETGRWNLDDYNQSK